MTRSSFLHSIRSRFLSLARSTRVLVVLLILEGIHAVAGLSGIDLPTAGPVRLLLVVVGAVWIVLRLLWLARKVLWPVRNRLLVTYFLVGVVPIALILAMVSIVATILMGQITGYLLISSLERRYENLGGMASNIALSTAFGEEAQSAATEALTDLRQGRSTLDAVVEVDGQPLARQTPAVLDRIPEWIEPGFGGLLVTDTNYLLAARSPVDASPRSVAVLVFEVLNPTILSQLLSGFATVQVVEGSALPRPGQLRNAPDVNDSILPNEIVEPPVAALVSANVVPLPEPAGFWDVPITWPSRVPARRFENGAEFPMGALMGSRPSLIVRELFSTFELAGFLGISLIVIAAVFLCVEAGSLFFIGGLTRSITRTVKDTYKATKQVEAGNLSHRIPIRADDQLNSMAASFNDMTENVQRLIAEVKEKERQDLELQIAREVQLGLFPKQQLHPGSLEVAGFCRPARSVSGDYYDFVHVDDRKIALVIGDVSGKGISAALLMASIQSSLQAQIMMAANSSAKFLSPAEIVGHLNEQLHRTTTSERFATFFCSVYDDDTEELRYTNAGHVPPIVVRQGSIVQLEPNGMIVGAFPDVRYEESRIKLHPGDLLVATTDGVTECENASGDQFGTDRLIELLVSNSMKSLEELTEIIVDSVSEWADDLPSQDDTTLLLARRPGS